MGEKRSSMYIVHTICQHISRLFFVVLLLCTNIAASTCPTTQASCQSQGYSTGTVSVSNIGDMACVVICQLTYFDELLVALSYITGIACVINALFKFKQHKDNPTQIPISAPIVMLFVGIFMIYLPSLVQGGAATVFGGSAESGGVFGENTSSIGN